MCMSAFQADTRRTPATCKEMKETEGKKRRKEKKTGACTLDHTFGSRASLHRAHRHQHQHQHEHEHVRAKNHPNPTQPLDSTRDAAARHPLYDAIPPLHETSSCVRAWSCSWLKGETETCAACSPPRAPEPPPPQQHHRRIAPETSNPRM